MCSKDDNHSRLNSQHNYGDLDDNSMSMRILTLIVNEIFIRASKIMRKVALPLIWLC